MARFSSKKPTVFDIQLYKMMNPTDTGIHPVFESTYQRRFIRQEPLLDCWEQIFKHYNDYVNKTLIGIVPLSLEQWLKKHYNVPVLRSPK
jgi:hypothetical protein